MTDEAHRATWHHADALPPDSLVPLNLPTSTPHLRLAFQYGFFAISSLESNCQEKDDKTISEFTIYFVTAVADLKDSPSRTGQPSRIGSGFPLTPSSTFSLLPVPGALKVKRRPVLPHRATAGLPFPVHAGLKMPGRHASDRDESPATDSDAAFRVLGCYETRRALPDDRSRFHQLNHSHHSVRAMTDPVFDTLRILHATRHQSACAAGIESVA
ncbi:hypothetical protein [Acidisoma silvae]|uniref:Uncharacterized protein n=1 Tax=Acidisoma silvae TaxID=2802396 RepID=A0A963YPT9_9PROT|nr:hypothetical protein [Acidisoma silvae]MCB8874811.1 hypothetical protein [Acidisoma silvae]